MGQDFLDIQYALRKKPREGFFLLLNTFWLGIMANLMRLLYQNPRKGYTKLEYAYPKKDGTL